MLRQRSFVAPRFRVIGKLKGRETGATLIETLVALALLGIISVAFLSGLATAAKATFIADEQATAESLARSQIEYVKSQDYDSTNNPPQYDKISDIPIGYDIDDILAERLDAKGDGTENDDGIQKITVTVTRGDKTVLIIDAYKVDR